MRNFRYQLKQQARWMSEIWNGKLLLITTLLGERCEEDKGGE